MSKVFMQIRYVSQTGKSDSKRVVFQLYPETPKTSDNFKKLCTGELGTKFLTGAAVPGGKQLAYKGSKFHRIIPQFMMQGGDFTNGNGTGGLSIYGNKFNDENFVKKHDKPLLLSMANAGPNTNGSQFFITFVACPWLDNKHTVFGRVTKGMETVQAIEKVKTDKTDKPAQDIKIINVEIF